MSDRYNKETIGIVLLNLGGPDSIQAIRPFLYNLFSDREIIRIGPPVFQKPIAWLISALRSGKTQSMYNLIGGKSPILDITIAQAEALEGALNSSFTTKDEGRRTRDEIVHHLSEQSERSSIIPPAFHFKVYVGMRYWRPFVRDTVQKVIEDGVRHMIVLSLFPQYSKATTGSAISEFKRAIKEIHLPTHPSPSRGEGKGGGGMKIQYIEEWYDFPPYIDALAEVIANGLSEFNPPLPTHNSPLSKGGYRGVKKEQEDITVLYSAHSLPEKFINEGDPYLEHIKATISAVNKRLSIPPHPPLGKGGQRGGGHSSLFRWHLAFQSKSGPVRWLQPSTGDTIIKLAQEGVKNVLVVPISFVSDHIETLYEIDILYKKLAEKHGINLKRCPSLNTSEKFIEALKELILERVESRE